MVDRPERRCRPAGGGAPPAEHISPAPEYGGWSVYLPPLWGLPLSRGRAAKLFANRRTNTSHSREGGNPCGGEPARGTGWIPAFAGMTVYICEAIRGRPENLAVLLSRGRAPARPPARLAGRLRRPAVLLAALALAACGGGEPERPGPDVVARIGEAVLSRSDLAAALGDVPAGLDSATAAEQIVEQWVQRELLVQEARARGLDTTAAVRQLLAESERATLEAAALESFFAQNPTAPDEDALRAYYDANREDLALREPYVRLRHLRLRDAGRAEEARAALARAARTPYADSLFALVAAEYADDPEGAVAFARTYVPEGRLLSLDEALGARVAQMAAGPEAAAVESGGVLHVVQVAARVRTGTVPPFGLVRDELEERLAVQTRRDMEARLLQELRARARAEGRLATPGAR